ncbi:MAG TPA: LL-diaminopimelate aminotransferase [bacterium]|nr:LL-diaminopimelate aminotransferase [bacterium]
MAIQIEWANRLKRLPPYLFAEIDKKKRELIKQGKDIIDLGVGDPDLPTPKHIIDKLAEAAKDPRNHRYALDAGMESFRSAIAKWYVKRFGVKVDPQKEVLPLIGSKEGIGHIPLAFVNNHDIVLVPDPAYPAYQSGSIFAGAEIYYMPLLEKNDFLPDLDAIDTQVAHRAKMMFINYPNNPTGATCGKDFFERTVEFAAENNIIVCHDAAYSELTFDNYKPHSFLEVPGAKEVGIEFHSLSKTYNMTGWRVGFVVGNKDIISGLARVKSNLDSGIFQAIQAAGVEALTGPQTFRKELLKIYQERRDVLIDGLDSLGWHVRKPKATFYVWANVPPGFTSSELSKLLLDKANIIATPGNGFGRSGEGYIRMTLCKPKERLEEAVARIKKMHDEWR